MVRGRVVLALLIAALFATPQPTAVPSPTPSPDVPIYAGKPATHFTASVRPLGFDTDGNARVLVVAHFLDGAGKTTRLLANSDVDWRSTDGYVQWQTRMRYGQPAAILAANHAGKLTLTMHVDKPELGTQRIVVDPSTWRGARVVAKPLGARTVAIGWFPRSATTVRIDRIDATGRRKTLVTIAGPSSSYRDTSVLPGRRYTYVVARANESPVRLAAIETASTPSPAATSNIAGKGVWLSFSTSPLDRDYYENLDPPTIVAQAVDAGLHYVELRTSYGAYDEIVPDAKATIDAIVDGLAAHGIGTIAWTVPRDASYDDLARSVAAAYYRTASGTRFAGLAVDLERGDEFMGGAPESATALWQYVRDVREALGPKYLIASTIEDPFVEHLTEANYPYAQIAHYSSVLQPMAYWRAMYGAKSSPATAASTFRASYAALKRETHSSLPISFGGLLGIATSDEIVASLAASKSLGALGVCYFDWNEMQPWQWATLRDYRTL